MTKRLLYLNGLAILMIPLQHASAYALQAMFMWTNVYLPVEVPNYDLLGTLPYHVVTFLRQISTFAVPGFLFISGFFISFLAKGKDAKVTWEQVLPRIKVLIFPFIIWTIIRFVLLRRFPENLEEALDPYHFVPLLIQFYLLSPFLVVLAKKNWKLLLIGAAVLHLSIQFFRYTETLGFRVPGQEWVFLLTPRWFVLGQQPFWFPLGLVVGLNVKDFQPWLVANRLKLFWIALFCLGLMIAEYYVAFYFSGELWLDDTFKGASFSGFGRNFYIVAILFYILSLEERVLPLPKFFADVGGKSLGIYMGNIPAIYVVAVLMYRFTPALLGIQVIYLPVLFIAGFWLPLLMMWIVRKTPLRVAYRYLFG